MANLIYDSMVSLEQLLDRGFRMPIHFAAIGIDGAVVAGTYVNSPTGAGFDCRFTAQSSQSNELAAPVNIMFVDSKGESALVVIRETAHGLPKSV